ncbi:hypothetical protein [Actinomadura oligospora]|uniref:hypothetical protein n=1 Tax=Actinomadura oligospora TaxID=111804 RepID=UPI00047B1E86|nr:hypothetical protein [Actinomadura oligospora]
MRNRTHHLAVPAVDLAGLPPQRPEPKQQPQRRGAELRRPPSEHGVRARRQAQGLRNVPRRRGY